MTTVSYTGSISSTGIGSGLDVNSIVTKLMSVESLPLTTLQNTASKLNTQLSAIGQLKSLTSAMRDAANKLTSLGLWKATKTSSSDTSAVTATTDTGAATGNYAVNVQTLASGQTVSSGAFLSSDSTVGQGTLTIELGSWSTDVPPVFSLNSGSSGLPIQVAAGDSLAAIRDKINASGSGVTATIVNDASGARLAVRSNDTGAENGFRMTGADDGTGSGAGLGALTYDPATPASSAMTLNQPAVNASATVNGISITSATNTLTGVADGLTLNLLKKTTGDVSVGVNNDDAAVTSAVNAFVSAYNGLANYIQSQTKYDPTSKTAGTLQGDFTTNNEESQMRGVINQQTTVSGLYSSLSDVGILVQADGTMAVDSTKLNSALAHRSDLKNLFMADGSTNDAQGFMTRFREMGDAMLNSDGSLTTRTSSIQTMLKSNSDDQAAMQARLDQTQQRLLAQYQALDTTMAQLTATASYLTGQLAAMNKTTA
jgi:flagellar hook-associated protein 2